MENDGVHHLAQLPVVSDTQRCLGYASVGLGTQVGIGTSASLMSHFSTLALHNKYAQEHHSLIYVTLALHNKYVQEHQHLSRHTLAR